MTVFARLASGQGYARAALLNLSLCLAFLLVGSSEAASSSSSSTETGMVGGNHSNATMGHGLHPHAAGGQGEIHFICFVLFAGFLFIKGKNKIICMLSAQTNFCQDIQGVPKKSIFLKFQDRKCIWKIWTVLDHVR